MTRETYAPGEPIELIDTTGMSNERWLEIREHGLGKSPMDEDYLPFTITGSGASSALGVNPWVSDLEYRDRKMGVTTALSADFNEESKAAGHVFEPFVAINFLRYMRSNFPSVKVNLIKDMMRDIMPYFEGACPDDKTYDEFCKSQDKVIKNLQKKWKLNPSSMYQCGTKNEDGTLRYPFALANIDGLVEVNGRLGIFEAKTTSTRSHAIRDYWDVGKIPPYYYWQLVFYMAVMNVDFAYITCIWGCTLNDMAVIYLERDVDVEFEFMEYLRQFVEDMEYGLPLEESKSDPELVSQYYYRLFGKVEPSDTPAELPPSAKPIVERCRELDEEIKEKESELNEVVKQKMSLFNKLHLMMKDISYAKVVLDDRTVVGIKLKTPMKRAKVDEERFVMENPSLAEEFSKSSIDWSALEKEHKGMKKKYTLPAEPNPEGKPTLELYTYSEKASE